MDTIKAFFQKKKIGYYFLFPSLACALAGLLVYQKTGVTVFSPSLSLGLIWALAIGLVLNFVSLFYEHKLVKYAVYLLYFYGFLEFLVSQATYLANVFVSIDGTGISLSFVLTFVLLLLAFALTLVSAILAPFDYFPFSSKEVRS